MSKMDVDGTLAKDVVMVDDGPPKKKFKIDENSRVVAIQALDGQTPGEKFKNLDIIATQLIENQEECQRFLNTSVTDRVRPGLISLLHVIVGNKVRSNEAIIEALKSEDVTVVKRALGSKFFFDATYNPNLNPEYFIDNILPYISPRTRRELIKVLGRRLTKNPSLAEEFYEKLTQVIPVDQVAPLAYAFSKKYIEEKDVLFQLEIDLSRRTLRAFYRKYPEFVIRSLEQDKVRYDYIKQLYPLLFKRHLKKFLELRHLYRGIDLKKLTINKKNEEKEEVCGTKELGSTRRKFFFKHGIETYVANPYKYYGLVNIKRISEFLLRINQFENMFFNLFPKIYDKKNEYGSNTFKYLLKYLEYYPENKKMSLIIKAFKSPDNLNPNFLLEPEFYRMSTDSDLKKKMAQQLLKPFKTKTEIEKHIHYLPPEDSIPKLRELIFKLSKEPRYKYFNQMLTSCAIYGQMDKLLEVLKYYSIKHTNENNDFFMRIIHKLYALFDLESFEKEHFHEMTLIVKRKFIKGELFTLDRWVYSSLIERLLSYYFTPKFVNLDDEEIQEDHETLMSIVIEGLLKHYQLFDMQKVFEKSDKKCFVKFVNVLEKNYNIGHEIWKNYKTKSKMIEYLLKTDYYGYVEKNPETEKSLWNWDIEDSSMIVVFVKELLALDDSTGINYYYHLHELKKFLRECYPNFYRTIQNFHGRPESPKLVKDSYKPKLEPEDLLKLLKNDHRKIEENCEKYLQVCRDSLAIRCYEKNSTKEFVLMTRWYSNIPYKFVEQCLNEIEKDGSLMVLGILLEGKYLSEIANFYLPEKHSLDLKDDNSKKTFEIVKQLTTAMTYTNPPVALDVVLKFCYGDFIKAARSTVSSIAERAQLTNLMNLGDIFFKLPVSTRKVVLFVILRSAPSDQLQKFLAERIKKERNPGIKNVIVKNVLELFKKFPNEQSWLLLETCIEGLTVDDFESKSDFDYEYILRSMDGSFVERYIRIYWAKIYSFSDFELDSEKKRERIFGLIRSLENFNVVTNDMFEKILKFIMAGKESEATKSFIDWSLKDFLDNCLSSKYEGVEPRLMTYYTFLESKITELDENRPFEIKFKESEVQLIWNLTLRLAKHSETYLNKLIVFLDSRFKPYEYPKIWLELQFNKEYNIIKSASEVTEKGIGLICAKKAEEWLNQFSKEFSLIFLKDICDVGISHVSDYDNPNSKYEFIEGLMEGHDYYGNLLGIQYLSSLKHSGRTLFTSKNGRKGRSEDDNENESKSEIEDKSVLEKHETYSRQLLEKWSQHNNEVIRTALHKYYFEKRNK